MENAYNLQRIFNKVVCKVPGPGGSRKGRPNKPKLVLLSALQRKFGKEWNPVVKMAEIAEDESNPVELRAQMYKEVAQYVEPKRKAIEVTGPEGGPISVVSSKPLSLEEWQAAHGE